jgi:hypothetical protein
VSIPSFVLVQGVITGLGYGLLAMGLVLIYRTNRVLNFAQGQLGVVAAVFMVKCFYDFGFNYWFALVMSLALAAAVGALSELLLRRLFNRPRVLVMVATIGLSQVLFVFTALPFIRPKNLFKPFPVPFDVSFHIGTYLFTPGQVMTLVAAPIVAIGLAVLRQVVPVGTGHAGHGRERRLGPAVGGVGPPHLDHGVDGGRRAVRLHRHSGRPRADLVADRGAQSRAAPVGPHRGVGRGHGEPDRGLRGRHRASG